MDYFIINIKREGKVIYYFSSQNDLITSTIYIEDQKRKYRNLKYNNTKISKINKPIKIDF
tara:strand:+ start:820 stop:999 length:180 start_codon:yes stop_codon:yes gene_type:complete